MLTWTCPECGVTYADQTEAGIAAAERGHPAEHAEPVEPVEGEVIA